VLHRAPLTVHGSVRCGAPGWRAIKSPDDSAGSDDPRTRAASKVRDTPKELTTTAYQMPANVVQAGG